MRVAILGMGAIGHVVARALEGRAELLKVDRTHAPLRDGAPPVDAAIVATKTPGTTWAAEIAAKILAPDGVGLTIQNGLGNYETLVEYVGRERAAVGVIYVGAQLVNRELRATGPGKVELGRPGAAAPRARLNELARSLRDGGWT
jgi:ketopantoate reductase